jgi:hypothetical protein
LSVICWALIPSARIAVLAEITFMGVLQEVNFWRQGREGAALPGARPSGLRGPSYTSGGLRGGGLAGGPGGLSPARLRSYCGGGSGTYSNSLIIPSPSSKR